MSINSDNLVIEEWRDLWSFKGDFIFVALAYSFSYYNLDWLRIDVINNGGGAYWIAYIVALFLCGLPLLVMELSIGQYVGRSPVRTIGSLVPLFKGVGVSLAILSLFFASIIAVKGAFYCVHFVYLFIDLVGGQSHPPWLQCQEYYYQRCFTVADEDVAVENGTLSDVRDFYFHEFVQHVTKIDDPGTVQWRLLAGLGAIWILVFIAIVAGVRWLGKICYLTGFLGVGILFTLFIRGMLLEGATEEITRIFVDKTDWEALLELKTWETAFCHTLQAFGLGLGSYITLASYHKRSNNVVGDAWIITICHFVITVTQFLTTVAFTGYIMANGIEEGKSTFEFGTSPDKTDPILDYLLVAVSSIPLGYMWAAFLLVMLCCFVLNSIYVLTLTVVSALEDAFFGNVSHRWIPRMFLTLFVCCLGFGSGVGYTINSGLNAYVMVRQILEFFTLWVLLAFEIIAVAWFYCAHQLGKDIRGMIENVFSWCCGFFWSYILYILPAVPVFILVVHFMNLSSVDYLYFHNTDNLSDWVEPVSWVIAVCPLIPIPVYMLYIVCRSCTQGPGFTCCDKLKYTVTSPMKYDIIKPQSPPRYTVTSPGYVLLPAAPLAEPEMYSDNYAGGDRLIKVSNI